ncbi:acyltransferase [Dyella sp.]|jgi:peptidoglycan/LPS O-acetylase OafA/YrhL|uniref:acyltransferase family protein n=1 Tax=Dyella sp. TaxID=1869338 RepID=UPI002D794896|nr:acyltransferase [Dyella sp.]HET6431950.1 acyltransferase [Dyella sp.]
MRAGGTTQSPGHLPALDGLRGVAILLVLLHGFDVIQPVGMLSRALDVGLDLGWIGVQLFFVLSGFLITGVLLDTRHAPHYYRSFFVRRVLRIFPLYYGVLLLAFVVLPWLGWSIGGGHQVWLWTYLANFAAPFGYGEPAFPHFWSLCVEEQFYLLWPVVVQRAGRRGVIAWSGLLVCIAIGSRLYVRHWLGEPIGHEAAYMFTPCRMDALAIGAVVAAFVRGDRSAAWIARQRASAVTGAGVALLLVGLLAGHTHRAGATMQGIGYTVIALGFALLLIGALRHGHWPARWLAWAPLRRCGRYSYGMYVFYAPLHAFVGLPLLAALGGPSTLGAAVLYSVAATAATFCLGALSWHGYERHFLAMKSLFAPMPVP